RRGHRQGGAVGWSARRRAGGNPLFVEILPRREMARLERRALLLAAGVGGVAGVVRGGDGLELLVEAAELVDDARGGLVHHHPQITTPRSLEQAGVHPPQAGIPPRPDPPTLKQAAPENSVPCRRPDVRPGRCPVL